MSIRKIMKAFIVAALCFAQIVPAVAGTTALKPLTNSAFVDLGTGNLLIEGNDTQKAIVCEADTQPIVSTTGCHIVGSRPLPFSTDSHLWGRAFGSSAMVIVSPLTASISGGATDANLNTQIAALIQAIQNGTAATQAAALTPPVQIKSQSLAVIDHASSTIGGAGNGGDSMLPLDAGTNYGAVINVTAASGTNPTFDLTLNECLDAANCTPIYQVQRIKAATSVPIVVPTQLLTGNRKWTWNLGGTSPSFTFSIVGTRGSAPAPLIRQFIDYSTLVPGTLGSTSPVWNIEGCKVGYVFISVSAQTGAVTIQGTMAADWNGTTGLFGTFGNTATSSTSFGIVASSFSNPPLAYVHNQVTTAGSGVSMNYNGIYCTN